MKYEIERMEIIYTFYFFAFFGKKWLKNYWHFVTGKTAKSILISCGVRPFLSDKYDITRHPNFKYTADADKRNTFDIEAFLSARLKLKPDEVCDVYEVDTEGV